MSNASISIVIFVAIARLLPAYIAWKKGHPFVLWWLFGAFFFVLALPIAILAAMNQGVLDSRKRDKGEVRCPYCKEFVRIDASVCPHCTRAITEQTAEAKAS